jgi:hypothetical protein
MLGGTGDPSHWVGTASVSMGAMSARGAVVGLVRLQADTDGLVAVALGFEVGLPQTLPASPIGEQAASSR